jgi:hypothetical protein
MYHVYHPLFFSFHNDHYFHHDDDDYGDDDDDGNGHTMMVYFNRLQEPSPTRPMSLTLSPLQLPRGAGRGAWVLVAEGAEGVGPEKENPGAAVAVVRRRRRQAGRKRSATKR